MSANMGRIEIEQKLEEAFGPDWKNLAIVTPVCVIPLATLPDEAAPAPPPSAGSYGVWQVAPSRRVDFDAHQSSFDAIAHLRSRYGDEPLSGWR